MSASVQAVELPQDALLQRYRRDGHYTDCFSVDLPDEGADGGISHAVYVEAFYTTWLFRIERLILRFAVSLPSTDSEARQLARGERGDFAAWRVEDRAPNQLLLTDFRGRTRSWLMLVTAPDDDSLPTRLLFGSAVVQRVDPVSGEASMPRTMRALMGFHKLYSRALLATARRRLLS